MEDTNMTKIIYLNDEHAQVSKKFAKNAKVFGSEEYLMWKEYRKDFPKAINCLFHLASFPPFLSFGHFASLGICHGLPGASCEASGMSPSRHHFEIVAGLYPHNSDASFVPIVSAIFFPPK